MNHEEEPQSYELRLARERAHLCVGELQAALAVFAAGAALFRLSVENLRVALHEVGRLDGGRPVV